MFEDSNSLTQPLTLMPVFNRWDCVTESWYCVGKVSELQGILSTQIGRQKLVVFRSQSGTVHCLDAFCAHLGLHLGTGQVRGDRLRCQFHHWSYAGNGEIEKPGCEKLIGRKLQSYPVELRYGLIWVWAGTEAKYPLPFHPDLAEGTYEYRLGAAYRRPSHPHVSLLNALDTQHVNTVHALDLNVTGHFSESPDGSHVHCEFEGRFLETSARGRRSAWFTGGNYKYAVRYVGATIGFLRALDGIRLFGFLRLTPMYATFGYRPVLDSGARAKSAASSASSASPASSEGSAKREGGSTVIQPIFLTPRRKGLLGRLFAELHLTLSSVIYTRLKNEDGVIYENLRFTPHFSKDDRIITQFIAHVNRLPKAPF